jgi:carbamoyl-phosphate synthase large subunit
VPRREDIASILVIGSGPIVIGQACEFDYSGTQGCKALRREGYRVVLVNSNPATIMTDPEFADATYVEPLTVESVARIIEKERPDALLPTLGGQTALNTTVALAEAGVLERFGVRLIGAGLDAIRRAEDRREFALTMHAAGLPLPRSGFAHSLDEALAVAGEVGYPVMVRPSFVLGGGGTGLAADPDELRAVAGRAVSESPISEVLVEESVAGWKEFELEVMRDGADNAVVICSIENIDPMGVHTGDSITVAPAMTLTDPEYQQMRDMALACIRAVGVDTGGSNIQFAVDPATGRQVIIEMNPRVSRSSALASKATGFPIAKIAALLAVGYRLDEIANDITGETLAAFEPTLDYVVVKVPRFAFEKFPQADPRLTTVMKSVGEVMAIGRTFTEALGKALRSLERPGFDFDAVVEVKTISPSAEATSGRGPLPLPQRDMKRSGEERDQRSYTLLRGPLPSPSASPAHVPAPGGVASPTETRVVELERAMHRGVSVDDAASDSKVDPWFVDQIALVAEISEALRGKDLALLSRADLFEAKRHGLSDARIGLLTGAEEDDVRRARRDLGVEAVFKTVDTCAGEFEARTPYYYSTYEEESEVWAAETPRVVILGAGPNRIGQGIEFDYACVHAAFALGEAGFETVMVNCNPETVSTDYDTSDRLYFEPLTVEDVLAVCRAERPEGVIVQLGGQTPLKLAHALEREGFRVLGTTPDSIDLAEDRGRFAALLKELGLPAPPHGEAATVEDARRIADGIGYPVLVRPSYVLGGRAMEIVYGPEELDAFVRTAAAASPDHPVLVDRFLEGAIEVDVDAVSDGTETFVGAVMEHIEEAGVHSGDSSCVIPPPTLSEEDLDRAESIARTLARALGVRGLLNVQLAVKDERMWVLEANPRSSRTVPFVSKVTGVPLAKVAALVMAGRTLADLRRDGLLPRTEPYRTLTHTAVKAAVLPFGRFPGVDTVLGPEMKSTGEVMGIDARLGPAMAKAFTATGTGLPARGTAFVSVANRDKRAIVFPAKRLADLGFRILATRGTAAVLHRAGISVTPVRKRSEGGSNVVDLIREGRIDIVINTPFGRGPRTDGSEIRMAAAAGGIPCVTTLPGVVAALQGIEALRAGLPAPRSLQEYHAPPAPPEQLRLVPPHDEPAVLAGEAG